MVLFAEAKVKAAGLSAHSAVSASAPYHRGQIAGSGHTHTECAVNKNLKLDICSGGNGFNLLKGKLSGEHHP